MDHIFKNFPDPLSSFKQICNICGRWKNFMSNKEKEECCGYFNPDKSDKEIYDNYIKCKLKL